MKMWPVQMVNKKLKRIIHSDLGNKYCVLCTMAGEIGEDLMHVYENHCT